MNQSEQSNDRHSTIYKAFMIRLWQEAPDSAWRVSAQSVKTGATVHFGTLAALFSFLREETTCTEHLPVALDNLPPQEKS